MYPAPSVIVFSVLSGAGFGLLAFLGLGFCAPTGWPAFFHWGLGYALAVGGLLAATLHLGQPRRALRAFSQWRTSWLSREGWAAVAALLALAPMALSDWLGLGWWSGFGLVGAVLAVATVGCTAMIYAQLRTIPRWNHWTTPALFGAFFLAGGALLSGQRLLAAVVLIGLGLLLAVSFILGDARFAARGHSLNSATGLTGGLRVFDQAHTADNYLLHEMIHIVGRRHSQKLRVIAGLCASVLPLFCLLIPGLFGWALAFGLHLIGAFAARWLFFAEAEHVVGLYYGRTPGL